MERYFQQLKVHKPVERNNYSFQLDDKLPWSEATYGPEDTYGDSGAGAKAHVKPVVEGRQMYFRTERQTLRRLPRTGCIMFTIRSYLVPLSELATEPGVPGRLAEAVRAWPEDMKTYKGGIRQYGETMIQYLDECHAKQVANGLFDPTQETTPSV